jgi:hypothetical protein
MLDVRQRARLEVVEADHPVPSREERLAKVGAEEAGAAGDKGRRHRARWYRCVGTGKRRAYEVLIAGTLVRGMAVNV